MIQRSMLNRIFSSSLNQQFSYEFELTKKPLEFSLDNFLAFFKGGFFLHGFYQAKFNPSFLGIIDELFPSRWGVRNLLSSENSRARTALESYLQMKSW